MSNNKRRRFEKNSIVVTGWGCLTATGLSANDSWSAIKEGRSGIDKINAWDTQDWEYFLGAALKNFDPKQFIDRKLLKLLSRHDIIGLGAVAESLKHSGLLTYRDSLADPTIFNERTGIYVASPGSKFHQQYDFFPLLTEASGNLEKFGTNLNSVVHPMWLLRTLPNNVLAYAAIIYGFKGANQNIINHSVGGVQALIEAKAAIDRGAIDRAIVVGYDSMVEPQTQTFYAALGVLSKAGLKPFDATRDGTLLGEGSGAIILEKLAEAEKRQAHVYGEIIGGRTTTEGMGVFPISEDGEGLTRVITDTLQHTNLTTADIGMITAHANGTSISDSIEANVYSALFAGNSPKITAFKWALGHTFAASGVIETIMTLLSLQEKIAPGIASLQQKAKECEQLNVSNAHQEITENTALLVSRGFGSINSCLAVAV